MADRLDPAALATALAALPDWAPAKDGAAIARTFSFDNFNQAWAFLSRSALLAEKMNHHPEWSNVYGRVEVVLNTHDAGGVTDLDLRMAAAMDRFAAALG